MSESQLEYASSIAESQRLGMDSRIVRLANQLSRIHGKVRITKEASGVHLYMASPICLKEYGKAELYKMHLALNADKYLKGVDLCGMCMKTNKPYSVEDLLSMKTSEQRGFTDVQHRVTIKDNNNYLEEDENGNKIPKPPGNVIPLTELPDDHPAIQYVRSRDFDPSELYKQFKASYCTRAREDYPTKRLPGGFYITPQCRVIFYIYVNGVRMGWQGRIMEFVDNGVKSYYHPTYDRWVQMEHKSDTGKFVPLPEVANGWNPAKYIHAPGTNTTHALMGYDAALQHQKETGENYIGLTEGPLDSARLGVPFCAVMGKHFNSDKASLLRKFDKVILAVQNDEASKTLLDAVTSIISIYGKKPLKVIAPPAEYNDFGEMPQHLVDELVKPEIRKYLEDNGR
jgi:hypothetical protein